jgi:hypothetical protein
MEVPDLRPAQSPFVLSNPAILRMLLETVLPSLEKGYPLLSRVSYRDLVFPANLFDGFASQ